MKDEIITKFCTLDICKLCTRFKQYRQGHLSGFQHSILKGSNFNKDLVSFLSADMYLWA